MADVGREEQAEEIVVEPRRTGRRRSRLRRIAVWLALACVVAGAVPALLGLFYKVEGVRPVSTLMLARWLTLQPVERRWVELEDISPVLVYSVIMSEDGQFCGHRGIDWRELNAVLDDALEGEATRGASTITMQTAKNLFLWHGRSVVRKALELPLAVYLDGVLTKKRIMEIYLNIAEWDEGVFGVEAAAQHYFSKPAKSLSAREAALLTVTLPAPRVRNPARPGPGLARLAGIIQNRAAKSGGYVQCMK